VPVTAQRSVPVVPIGMVIFSGSSFTVGLMADDTV